MDGTKEGIQVMDAALELESEVTKKKPKHKRKHDKLKPSNTHDIQY